MTKTQRTESTIKASIVSDKKRVSQHLDQDNFCYRGDDCEQANQGQQIVGKDNDAKGFNDQSNNLPLITPGTGVGDGTGIKLMHRHPEQLLQKLYNSVYKPDNPA